MPWLDCSRPWVAAGRPIPNETGLPVGPGRGSGYFYGVVLGLAALADYEGSPHRYTYYDQGHARLKVYEWLHPWHAGNHISFMLETGELDEMLQRVGDAGIETRPPEIMRWGGRVAAVVDPFGNIVNLRDATQAGHTP